MALGFGIGIPFIRVSRGAAIDAQAQAHFDRVIADGGIVPAGLPALSAFYTAVKTARGQSDINNCFLSQYYAGFGIKTATGVGATAGGRACEKLYNLIGTTNDAIQTSAANQPLALVHSGQNYVYLPAISGNNFTTPDSANNQLLNDFGIEVICKSPNLSTGTFIAKSTGSGASSNFWFRSMSIPQVLVAQGGVNNIYSATTSTPFSNNQVAYLRVSRNATTGIIKFFTSTDGVNYTQLGADVAGVTGSANNVSRIVEIGSNAGGVANLFLGEIFSVKLFKNDTFTAPTQIFNPESYNRVASQTTWTSTTGEVYTLNTAATNNALKAAIVDQTMIMGNGASYGLRAANLNINQTAITSYTAFRKFVNTAGLQVVNELGANILSQQGKALFISSNASQEDIWITANVGGYNSRYTSNALSLKLATAINNIANANESSPYLINNVSQTFVASDSTANNTTAINATGYNLLARNNAASLWANAILIGDAICAGEDSAPIQTEMWDVYKTLLKIA